MRGQWSRYLLLLALKKDCPLLQVWLTADSRNFIVLSFFAHNNGVHPINTFLGMQTHYTNLINHVVLGYNIANIMFNF